MDSKCAHELAPIKKGTRRERKMDGIKSNKINNHEWIFLWGNSFEKSNKSSGAQSIRGTKSRKSDRESEIETGWNIIREAQIVYVRCQMTVFEFYDLNTFIKLYGNI